MSVEPRPVPTKAQEKYPDAMVRDIGPPKGISADDCGTAAVLIDQQIDGPWKGLFTFHMYFQPTKQQIEQLQNGAYIEVAMTGNGLMPHYVTIQEA